MIEGNLPEAIEKEIDAIETVCKESYDIRLDLRHLRTLIQRELGRPDINSELLEALKLARLGFRKSAFSEDGLDGEDALIIHDKIDEAISRAESGSND